MKPVTEKRVHEIVDKKLSMHIAYPAPLGHKGLGKLMAKAKPRKRKASHPQSHEEFEAL